MNGEIRAKTKPIDLALQACRKRQSPRTGMVHLSYQDPLSTDTIPLYENFCFAMALCAQKKAETVLEARELLLRLAAFQTPEGNFPSYLHDFPRCFDPHVGLKIGPLLKRLIGEYGSVLGSDCKQKLEAALHRAIAFASTRNLPDLWKRRLLSLEGKPFATADLTCDSLDDLWENLISLQFSETPKISCVHPTLGVSVGPPHRIAQYEWEPAPHPVEWMASDDWTPRLLKDHPRQIHLAALSSIERVDPPDLQDSFCFAADTTAESPHQEAYRLLWSGASLHSLVLPKTEARYTAHPDGFTIELPRQFDPSRNDLIETALYCDASPEVELWINDKKGTVFGFGDRIEIRTPGRSVEFVFSLLSGEGDFCGHILKANRPSQTATTGARQYEAFDWKIALRTLRRSEECAIRLYRSDLVSL